MDWSGGKLGGVEGGENCDRKYYVKKNVYFSIKRRKLLKVILGKVLWLKSIASFS